MKIYNERAMLEAIEFYELFNEFELAQEVRAHYKILRDELREQQTFKFKGLVRAISLRICE